MDSARRRSPAVVVCRVLARTFYHLVHHPLVVLGVFGLAVFLLFGGPAALLQRAAPAAAPIDDAAEQYMRGLRDKDVTELFGSLSADMRRTIEQRFGRLGPAAVAALFSEQDQRGEKIVGYQLVGRYDTVQGEGLRFYVVQAQRGNQRQDVP